MQEYNSDNYQEKYNVVKRKIEARLLLFIHVAAWLLVIILAFLASNHYVSLHGDAFVFLGGWTFGLVMHFMAVRHCFTRPNLLKFELKPRKGLIEKMIEHELQNQYLDVNQTLNQWPQPNKFRN